MGTISTRAAVIVAPRDSPLDLADRSAPPTSEELLRRRWDLPIGHPDRATIRAEVVEEYLPMARRLARRYGGTGELSEDLAQVAALALVTVVDRYDPDRRVPFVGYAVRRVDGWPARTRTPGPDHAVLRRDEPGEHRHRAGHVPDADLPASATDSDPASAGPGRDRGLVRTSLAASASRQVRGGPGHEQAGDDVARVSRLTRCGPGVAMSLMLQRLMWRMFIARTG